MHLIGRQWNHWKKDQMIIIKTATKTGSSESLWDHHGTPGALKTPIIFLKIQKLSRYMWTICWTISFRHKDITETSEEHWGKNYINANIFFFKHGERKSGIEHDFQISAFDTNALTHTHTRTLSVSSTLCENTQSKSTKSKSYTSMWLNISYCCHILQKLCFIHLTSVDIIHLQNKIYISALFHGATSF